MINHIINGVFYWEMIQHREYQNPGDAVSILSVCLRNGRKLWIDRIFYHNRTVMDQIPVKHKTAVTEVDTIKCHTGCFTGGKQSAVKGIGECCMGMS